ncbi:hypothetical protein BKA57DRAFT_449306 [Linnemannia elongata]|nr:hypothetical protein BKA57DRAFT_449306 [Linnemannia elongata]
MTPRKQWFLLLRLFFLHVPLLFISFSPSSLFFFLFSDSSLHHRHLLLSFTASPLISSSPPSLYPNPLLTPPLTQLLLLTLFDPPTSRPRSYSLFLSTTLHNSRQQSTTPTAVSTSESNFSLLRDIPLHFCHQKQRNFSTELNKAMPTP